MAPEPRLEPTQHGLVPKGDGWFVLNAREARWLHAPVTAWASSRRRATQRRRTQASPGAPTRYREGWLPE